MEPVLTSELQIQARSQVITYRPGGEGGARCSGGKGHDVFPKCQPLPVQGFSVKSCGRRIWHSGVKGSTGDLEFFKDLGHPHMFQSPNAA